MPYIIPGFAKNKMIESCSQGAPSVTEEAETEQTVHHSVDFTVTEGMCLQDCPWEIGSL